MERTGYLPQVLNAKKIDSTTFTISASLEAIGEEFIICRLMNWCYSTSARRFCFHCFDFVVH